MTIVVSQVGAAHAAVMAAIHTDGFDHPWSADTLVTLLGGPGVMAFIAMEADEPLGFILSRVVVDEAEVLTIAVRAEFRRRGIGALLLRAAAEHAVSAGAERFFLEVAEGNMAARCLYSSLTFTEVGRRKAYYDLPGGRQDALVLVAPLPFNL